MLNETENHKLRSELALLQQQNQLLLAANGELQQQLTLLQQQLVAALAKIAALEQQAKPLSAFVKPNAAKAEPKSRRKRDPKHNHGRKLEKPTHFQQHALDNCSTCGYLLRGQSIARKRQVVELPPPQPVEITEHQIIKRWCPKCEHWQQPKDPVEQLVLGQGRIGVRVAALLAYLRYSLRLPVRQISRYLATMHSLQLSNGEIIELLHRLHERLADEVAKLRYQAQASTILHGDETGWRQGGQNGYVWSFCTPDDAGAQAVRYYEYDKSRGEGVVKRILHGFKGLLISDFLASYNIYAGKHQRCWVHLLRDLHELKEKHGQDNAVLLWAAQVRELYDDGKGLLARDGPVEQAGREQLYVELIGRAHELGLAYSEAKHYRGHPCHALSKRILRHEAELFQFVLVEGASADNNQAERSIRPLVVVRKISGGSRSVKGTQSRLGLFSLLETWRVRGLNPFDELLKLLSLPVLLPQI